MAFFFLPSPIQNRGGERIERRPAWGEGAPTVPPMAAAGKWLKMERRPGGFYSRAHLELGRRREMDQRAAAVCLLAALVAARWGAGRAVEARLARCGAVRGWCWPFIGDVGRFPGKISLRRPRRRLRQGGPRWSALDWRCDGSGEVTYRPVDGTTRAGEGLGRPWWQRRQRGGAVLRDGSGGRSSLARAVRLARLAGAGDQARRGPAEA
jgi:hypothetical protein